MSQLLALSFDADSCPSIHLEPWTRTVKHHREMTGWGFAWYPNSAPAAMVIKDPIPTGDTPLSTFLRDWDRFQSTIFLCHMRGAAKRTTHRDTHPFSQTYAGYDWLLAHNGDLDPDFVNALPLSADGVFLPMGRTDSERVLCWLLDQCRALGARRLADLGWDTLNAWLRELNQHGTLNLLLSDGRDVVAYRDATGFASLHLCRRQPPHEGARMSNGVLELHLDHALDANRTLALVASTPLEPGEWHAIPPGDMVVLRRGAVVFTSGPNLGQTIAARVPPATAASTPRGRGPRVFDPTIVAESRVLRVSLDTVYRYEQPVTHSTHLLRLKPSHAPGQYLLAFGLDVSVNSQARETDEQVGEVLTHTLALDVDVEGRGHQCGGARQILEVPVQALVDVDEGLDEIVVLARSEPLRVLDELDELRLGQLRGQEIRQHHLSLPGHPHQRQRQPVHG